MAHIRSSGIQTHRHVPNAANLCVRHWQNNACIVEQTGIDVQLHSLQIKNGSTRGRVALPARHGGFRNFCGVDDWYWFALLGEVSAATLRSATALSSSHFQRIEALKNSSRLTMLLEA